ncbi:MAG: helix-turn-helix domain-containing protein [Nostoc sp. ZfuVER08]|nr:helix-turn-helix domain-containing protein [Nostoc sp. ZfuVER08]
MSIVVAGKSLKKNYTPISNELIRSSKIDDSTFRLICWMTSHEEGFEINFTSIQNALGYGRDKLRKILKNAEIYNYLVRRKVRSSGGLFDFEYHIFKDTTDAIAFRQSLPYEYVCSPSTEASKTPTGSPQAELTPDLSDTDEPTRGVKTGGGRTGGGRTRGGATRGGESTPLYIEKQLEENQKEEKHIQETPPTQESCVCEETDLEELNQEYEPISESDFEKLNHQEEPIPQSPTSLSTKSESSHQTDQPSCRPTMAGALFDKNEQVNNKPSKPKFQSVEDLLNQILLDPGIMASDPLPAVYKSEIKLRGWRFPWRTATRDKIYQTCNSALVELIAKERAKWSKCEWTEKIPTVIKSIGNLEATKGGLEELLGYWSKVVESAASPTETSQATTDPIGYYSNRSLEWHKATFCELLDLGDKVGTDRAIAQFSTRYDQQYTGATDGWLNWLQINYPQIYAHLYPQAA